MTARPTVGSARRHGARRPDPPAGPGGRTPEETVPPTAAQARFLVELAGETGSLEAIRDIADRARRAAAEVSGEGIPVRFLRVVYLPEDGACVLLFAAPSARAAAAAVARAGLGAERVSRSVAAGVATGSAVR